MTNPLYIQQLMAATKEFVRLENEALAIDDRDYSSDAMSYTNRYPIDELQPRHLHAFMLMAALVGEKDSPYEGNNGKVIASPDEGGGWILTINGSVSFCLPTQQGWQLRGKPVRTSFDGDFNAFNPLSIHVEYERYDLPDLGACMMKVIELEGMHGTDGENTGNRIVDTNEQCGAE